jgi:hypothetical protein
MVITRIETYNSRNRCNADSFSAFLGCDFALWGQKNQIRGDERTGGTISDRFSISVTLVDIDLSRGAKNSAGTY